MQIAVVGAGYVGLVSATCFAELGHTVIGVDIDAAKVAMLQAGKSPIFEPGLEEILQRNLSQGRLSFTTDLAAALKDAPVLFSAVATPPDEGHKADLRAVFTVADTVAEHLDHDLVFVNKSTVPVGTGKACEERIAAVLKKRGARFAVPVVSNPEFLREGMAVSDTLMPDRIIVGLNGHPKAKEVMEELYRPITRVGKPLIFMQRESAEIVKYASNAFLATKISFINMLTPLCELTGASIRDVALGMGLDNRIGPRFLHAGIGYGGSCFPKDVKALLATAKEYGIPMPIVEATDAVNRWQRQRFLNRILASLPTKATVAVWGLSFKPKTDDLREAPSLEYLAMLTKAGHTVQTFDPVAMEKAKPLSPKSVIFCASPLEAATGADALVVVTEWDLFRGIDLKAVRSAMRGNWLFDGRNMYERKEVEEAGFKYTCLGIALS
jgi:UDPglucose 6-dehydrogenase